MAILGDAWVVIRAITKSLNKDIKDGLDGAAKDAEAAGDKAGAAYAKGLGDKASADLKDALGDAIDDAADDADGRARRRGDGIGKKLASGVLSGLSGALSALASLTAGFAMVTGLIGLIGSLIGAIGALAAGAIALTAALGPALAAIGIVGVAALGAFIGVIGSAIGIFKQLSDETAELGKNGLAVKDAWSDLKDQFKDVFATVGENKVFGPLNDLVRTLGDELFPSLSHAIEGFGGVIGNTISKLNALFENPQFQSSFTTAIDAMIPLADSFGSVLVDLIAVFVSLVAAAKPAIDMFAAWFKSWGENLRTVTDTGLETGKLGNFFTNAAAKGAQFFDILGNLWDVLKNVFKAAAPLGAVFLDNFQVAANALNTATSSVQGFAKITDFFKPGGQVHQNITAVWQVVKKLGGSVAELAQSDGIDELARSITRLLPGATKIVESAIGAVGTFGEALANGINTPAGASGIKAVQDGLSNLGDAFADLGPAIGPLLKIIGDLGTNLSKVLGPAFAAIAETLPKLVGPLDQFEEALGGVLVHAIEGILKVLPPLLEIIAQLEDAFAGPLESAIDVTAGVLYVLLGALEAIMPVFKVLAPLITAVVVALLSMKGIAAINTLLGTMALRLASVAGAATATAAASGAAGAAGAMGGMAGAARGLVAVMGGPWGIAIAAATVLTIGFMAQVQQATDQEEKWSTQLLKGGEAAAAVRKEYENQDYFGRSLDEWTGLAASMDDAEKQMWETVAAMDPLTQSTALLEKAQADYNYALEQGDPGDLIIAEYNLRDATAAHKDAMYDAAGQAGGYAAQLQLVIDTLYAKEAAELAASDASLALQSSIYRTVDAEARLAELRADPNSTAEQIAQAEIAVQQAYNASAQGALTAAGQFSQAAIQQGYFADTFEGRAHAVEAGLQGTVRNLQAMADQATGPTKDAILAVIENLKSMDNYELEPVDITVHNEEAISRLEEFATELGNAMGVDLPTVIPHVDNTQALTGIGGIIEGLFQVEGTKSETEIEVATDSALGGIGDVLNSLLTIDGTESTAEISAMVEQANDDINGIIQNMFLVDGQVATPEVQAQMDAAQQQLQTIIYQMLGLDTASATPTAALDDQVSGPVHNLMGNTMPMLDVTTANPSAFLVDGVSGPVNVLTGGLNKFDAKVAKPKADLDPNPFNGAAANVNGQLNTLNNRKAIPKADIDFGGLSKSQVKAMKQVDDLNARVAKPTAQLNDQASGPIAAIQRALNNLQNKTITVTTVSKAVKANASGGLVNEDTWSTVGEEGREMVFLSQGSYVATYQKAQKILAAASMQAAGLAGGGGGTTTLTPVQVATPGGVTIPITVHPSAGMNELDLARKTGREFYFQYRKLT